MAKPIKTGRAHKKQTHHANAHHHHSSKGHSKYLASAVKVVKRVRRWRWWQRWPLYILLFIMIFQLVSWFIDDKLMPPVKNPEYGVSFSTQYAKELGNDWQANYLGLLNDLGFKHLRLMSYWEDIEPQPGQYDFSDLDWQIKQADAHHAKVSLAIGYRQPRWPECHEPAWASKLNENSNTWDNALFSYMHTVINRYKNNPSIESYQMENEVANAWFGVCPGSIPPRTRLIKEFNLVKQWDPRHPVWMSLGDEHGYPVWGPKPDAYGFSIYRIVYSTNTPVHFYVTYPITDWYHRLRAFIIRQTQHRPAYIHELQLEPWGSKTTVEMTIAEQNKSMSVAQIHKNIMFARKTGIKEEYMWGGEWWYWRKVHFNDSGPWNAIKQEIQAAQNNNY
jgi:Beta-galactosidase